MRNLCRLSVEPWRTFTLKEWACERDKQMRPIRWEINLNSVLKGKAESFEKEAQENSTKVFQEVIQERA